MEQQLDWSGFSDEGSGAPSDPDSPEKFEGSLDWTGASEEQVQQKPILTPEEVLQIAENEPERFRAAMERVRARENKGIVERINEYQGPLLRGAARGGEGVGNFVVNSVMRGMSYVPGLEGLSDKADHNNRLAAIQSAYDSYQDENSWLAENTFVGATGAKFTGSIGETISQGLLLGGAGRATGAANTAKGMAAFMAASYGAMDTERQLTVAEDAGLSGVQRNIYATGMGALTGGLTYAFGRAGEKLGGHTMEELMSRGAGRSITALMTREGLKQELIDSAMEGTEEGTIAVAQAAYSSMMGVQEDQDYASQFTQAFAAGATARGVMGVGRALPEKFSQVLGKVPKTYKGFELAQRQAEGAVSTEEIASAITDPDVKAAYDAEVEAIASLGKEQAEIERRMDPFVARRAELETSKAGIETLRKEVQDLESELPRASRVHPLRKGDPAALLTKMRADAAELQAEYDDLMTKATDKKTNLELRDEYALQAKDIEDDLEATKSKIASWESEATTPTARSQYTEFYNRFPQDRYGEKVTVATMRDMFPELSRQDFDSMVLAMAKEGRLSLMAATAENKDERISEGGIPSSTGRMRHILFVKDPTKMPSVPEAPASETEAAIDPAKVAALEEKRAALFDAESKIKESEGQLSTEEQAAQADVQKRKDFLNAEIERRVARQEKIEKGQALNDATAAKQEFIERDRKKFGLDELAPEEAQAWLDSLQTARSKGVPQKALEISKQAVAGGEIWDSETTIGVTAGYDLVKRQWEDVRDKLTKSTNDVETETLMALERQMTDELGVISEAIHRVGTKQGRALAIRKFIVPVDGDPDMVLKRARKSKGEQLNPEEIRSVMEAAATVKKLSAERDALTAGTPEFDEKNFELYVARLRLESAGDVPGVKSLKDRVAGLNFLWREIVTGVDLSVAGIQGALSMLSRPTVAVPAMWKGFNSHITEAKALRAEYDLFTRKNGDLYKDGYVTIQTEKSPLMRNEDLSMQTMYGFWSKIPGVQPFLNLWPRVYRGMVNHLRADMYDAMIQSAGGRGNLTTTTLKDLGGLVDVMTGRGGRGYLDKHIDTLNLAMFAPRFSFSQLEFLIGKPIWGASAESRKYVMKEYGRILTSWIALYSAAALGNMFSNASGEGDIMETVWDPTDSNFMKIKIGNTWVDPTFRLARWIAAGSQTSNAIYNNLSGTQGTPVVGLDGKPITIGQPPKGLDARRAGSFVRGKLSLPVGSVVDLTTGKFMTGENVSVTGFFKNRVAPIAPKEIAQAMVDHGVSEQLATAMMGFLGAPLRPYHAPEPTKLNLKF